MPTLSLWLARSANAPQFDGVVYEIENSPPSAQFEGEARVTYEATTGETTVSGIKT